MTVLGIAYESHSNRNIAIALTDRYPQPTKGEIMLKNHKGEFCQVNRNLFCQEGYCSECEIYQRRSKDDRNRVNKTRPEKGQAKTSMDAPIIPNL